jgi:hypothetical protein
MLAAFVSLQGIDHFSHSDYLMHLQYCFARRSSVTLLSQLFGEQRASACPSDGTGYAGLGSITCPDIDDVKLIPEGAC